QYIARLIFTFNYKRNLSWKIGLFGGVATTALVYFMLIKGLGGSSLMSAEAKVWLDGNTWTVIWMCFVVSTVIMQVLHWLKVNVFKVIVMMGTFALAMAFAGNDLVNFIGVPIAGYDTYVDFMANSGGDIENYLMTSLNESYPTPFFFLLTAGLIMVVTLATSKKAKIVLKTSLDLSRQDTGDEMFGSSAMARGMVRGATQMATAIDKWMPDGLKRWINSRFNYNESIMEDKAAFDLVRGSVNLVLAGMLIALGTSLQLPLSTTFVAFMVGMGSSLADRAWGRDSAVYRVTGVFSVIGGWLFTAVAAFLLAFIIAIILHFGGIVAMILVLALAIFLVVRNSFKAKEKTEPENPAYNEMMTTKDNDRRLHLLLEHNRNSVLDILDYSNNAYNKVIDGFLKEDVRLLKKSITGAAEAKSRMKIMKRKEIMVMRMLDPMVMMKKNTWFHLSYNCCEQMLYSIRRICDPCKEHVDNSFTPLDGKYRDEILYIKNLVAEAADITRNAITSSDYSNLEPIRDKIKARKDIILGIRRQQMDRISQNDDNIDVSTLYLSIIQESEELITEMRHLVRDISKLSE
ncbi:MAG: inorganic phosphate transporter, partial [Tidjanibacter sp.]|nr:inorganic phosphate transporter [Tidjanibacter sp.]